LGVLVYVLIFLVLGFAETVFLDATARSTNTNTLQAVNALVALVGAIVVDRLVVRRRRV
jgi:hypothetical protein